MNNILLVIPARKGSGFFRKNLKLVSGIPLVRHTLNASKISIPHDTLVTTDDSYIIEEASPFNAIIDERPDNLSNDESTLDDVMYYVAVNYAYDVYVCLPPTSPLRTKDHIEEAIDKFLETKADSLISVTEERKSIWKLDQDNLAKPLVERTKNRQKEIPCYISNGAIFISKRELILKNRKKASGNTILYPMSEKDSVDVHNERDIRLAEFNLKENQ